jgi:subtilisin family serine protease
MDNHHRTLAMRNSLMSTTLAALLAACGGGGGGETGVEGPESAASAPAQTIQRDVVVMLASGASIDAVAASYGATVADQFGKRPIYRLRLSGSAAVDSALAAMRTDARLRFAERNVDSETPEGRKQVVWAFGGDAGSYATQWAPAALALPQAHALSIGQGVRVAVLDTGIDLAHPALASRLARSGSGAVLGRDFVDDDADPSEVGTSDDLGWGHGTHVSGLVALAAPGAQIMPVRVLDASGRGNAWVLAEALMWAIDPDGDPATDDGAQVVNISLGTTVPTRLLNTAIELATCSDDDDNEAEDDYSDPGFDDDRRRCDLQYGVVVMAAAGNGASTTEQQWPAAEKADGQLSIAATQSLGTLASFTNSGSWIQLAAPGDQIVSTMPGGGYATWSGTSMATPLASGVAALVLARNPSWKPVDVTKRLQDRGIKLCGSTSLKGLHAHGAVADFVPSDTVCR